MIRTDVVRRVARKLSEEELRRLKESLDHGLTKPHHELSELIRKLIDGNHHVDIRQAARIKSAIKSLTSEELEWLSEYIERYDPD